MNYKKYLLNLCKDRGITKMQLAKKLGVSLVYIVNVGTSKGISYKRLTEIIKLLDLNFDETVKLRKLAKYSAPKNKIIIDAEFVSSVVHEAKGIEYKYIIAATLKFAGIKYQIKRD
jgi:transcriptional regulator with XRE-family HTH domain